MNDTAPDIEKRFLKMLLQPSGEERLKMGCSMHATAKALARASILQKQPDASPATICRALFLRFYGHEFDTEARERILLALTSPFHPDPKPTIVGGARQPSWGGPGGGGSRTARPSA